MTLPRIALIGAGRMGSNHARVIAESGLALLALVVDVDISRARRLAERWGTAWSGDLDAAHDMDAAVVTTSTSSHFHIAETLIDQGVPLLVEKPVAPDIAQARDLVRTADAGDVVLMCGFVERFNASFTELVGRSDVRRARHVDLVRIGLAPHHVHSSVVDDVLLHDIDLLMRLFPNDAVTAVRAAGSDCGPSDGWIESVHCEMALASGVTASLHSSRVSTVRQRSITITRDDGRIERADLLVNSGDPLVAQWARFLDLVEHPSPERDAERRTVLPSHEIAHRIESLLTRRLPDAAAPMPGRPAAAR